MRLFEAFEPLNLIRNIQNAKTTGRDLSQSELALLQAKLIVAENNPQIIRVVRGEGRKKILTEIVQRDDILFDWGIKSQQAFNDESPIRNFLEPNAIDVEQMKWIIEQYQNAIRYRLERHFSAVNRELETHTNIVQKLNEIVDENSFSRERLLFIKDWLCFVLHTAGDKDFKGISPWVSVTTGLDRYKTAYCFGQGKTRYLSTKRHHVVNSKFVIFDTWVCPHDEHIAFERTAYLRETMNQIGLPWYKDIHQEIILKYAIYPHRLIGYYFIENDEIQYYYVNPHYIDKWQVNTDFQIGDDLYIDQGFVRFPAKNPYRMIYSRYGNRFDVYERR